MASGRNRYIGMGDLAARRAWLERQRPLYDYLVDQARHGLAEEQRQFGRILQALVDCAQLLAGDGHPFTNRVAPALVGRGLVDRRAALEELRPHLRPIHEALLKCFPFRAEYNALSLVPTTVCQVSEDLVGRGHPFEPAPPHSIGQRG